MTLPELRSLSPEECACMRFLYREAELLDDQRFSEWLGLLTDDIAYQIPTRTTRPRSDLDAQFSKTSFIMIDDFETLQLRVRRLEGEYAFAEDPPSRTRRFVSNIRVSEPTVTGELAVKSNIMFFRARFDSPPTLIAGERHDTLRHTDEGIRLAARTVLLDHTLLPMENFALFI
jgi:3-phenylpropionate/cinnamic acid dioxygenase small subunit